VVVSKYSHSDMTWRHCFQFKASIHPHLQWSGWTDTWAHWCHCGGCL